MYRAARLVELAGRSPEGREAAGAIIAAIGPAAGPALLDAVRSQTTDAKDSRGAVQLLCDHAVLVAPSLVAALGATGTPERSQRTIARVLGFAGHGYEVPLGKLLDSRDEQTVREALRSLARIGTPRAAALVGAQVLANRDWVGKAAEETLWHFPTHRIRSPDPRPARTARVRRPATAGRRPAARARGAGRRGQPRADSADARAAPLSLLEPGPRPRRATGQDLLNQ